jgi:hypothetical protein
MAGEGEKMAEKKPGIYNSRQQMVVRMEKMA